jgi:hypothetical protein
MNTIINFFKILHFSFLRIKFLNSIKPYIFKLYIINILEKPIFNHYNEFIDANLSIHIYHHMSLFIKMKLLFLCVLIIITRTFSKILIIPFVISQNFFAYQVYPSRVLLAHDSFSIVLYLLSKEVFILKMYLHTHWYLLIDL